MCDCVFLKVLKLLYHSLYLSKKYRGKTDVCSIVFCSFFFAAVASLKTKLHLYRSRSRPVFRLQLPISYLLEASNFAEERAKGDTLEFGRHSERLFDAFAFKPT